MSYHIMSYHRSLYSPKSVLHMPGSLPPAVPFLCGTRMGCHRSGCHRVFLGWAALNSTFLSFFLSFSGSSGPLGALPWRGFQMSSRTTATARTGIWRKASQRPRESASFQALELESSSSPLRVLLRGYAEASKIMHKDDLSFDEVTFRSLFYMPLQARFQMVAKQMEPPWLLFTSLYRTSKN